MNCLRLDLLNSQSLRQTHQQYHLLIKYKLLNINYSVAFALLELNHQINIMHYLLYWRVLLKTELSLWKLNSSVLFLFLQQLLIQFRVNFIDILVHKSTGINFNQEITQLIKNLKPMRMKT